MPYEIGQILKTYRNKANVTAKDISDILTQKGFKASESTIYSWENGNSQPTPGALLEMCSVYKIENILDAFGYDGYNEDGSISLNMKETEIIEKYRDLDEHGKETVDFVLEREWNRSTAPKETVTVFSIPYAYDLAASAGTGEYAMDIAHFENVGITQKPPKGASFLIRVSGNSMEPEYFDNDKVFVKRMDDVDDGEIGLFFLDGDVYIKEKNANGLRSLNPDYQIIPVNEYSSIKCYGKIIGKCDCDITEI